MSQKTSYLHLRTQNGQPYGSVRRCCERCGAMIWPEMQDDATPEWTDNEQAYSADEHRYELRPTAQ